MSASKEVRIVEKKLGTVTHFYSNLSVAIVKLDSELSVGQTVKFVGHTTDFEQEVTEIQHDHKEVQTGKKGQEVGIKVKNQARVNDEVFLVE